MNLDRDLLLAKRLQKEFNEETKRRKRKENNANKPNEVVPETYPGGKLALIDPKLEYIDPNPDIHSLFLHFDKLFFWKKLQAVEVKWSPRMTSCAGICCYQGRGGLCSIRLSLPLLKLRPRKDLVETLLHEMIHAYLFVTHNNRDRDGHGPEFHKHMHRINQSAGTKITVFHTFHDEVRSYQQHWWKCQGPCRNRPPYFGMVRRAMNRAPGPSDFWWADHQATCGGTYVKIREPEGYSASKKGKGVKAAGGKGKAASSKTEFPSLTAPKKIGKPTGFGVSGGIAAPNSGIYGYFSPSKAVSDQKTTSKFGGFLGNRSSQVSSLIVTEGSKSKSLETSETTTKKPFVPFFGQGQVLGSGNSTQRPTLPQQCLLTDKKGSQSVKKDILKRSNGKCDSASPGKRPRNEKLPSSNNSVASSSSSKPPTGSFFSSHNSVASSSSSKPPTGSFFSSHQQVKCPVCNSLQNEATINDHLDGCITSQSQSTDDDVVCLDSSTPVKGDVESWYLECPGCREKVKENDFDNHLNSCESICGDESSHESPSKEDNSALSLDDVPGCPTCPICGQTLSGTALGDHLDTCLSSMPFDEEEEEWS